MAPGQGDDTGGSQAGEVMLELQTIHRFSQSRRRHLPGPRAFSYLKALYSRAFSMKMDLDLVRSMSSVCVLSGRESGRKLQVQH